MLFFLRQEVEHRIEAGKGEQKNDAVHSTDFTVQREDIGEYREKDHDGDFTSQQNRLDAERRDQASRAQDQTDVGDVRTNDVANRQIALPRQGGLSAYQ